MNDLYYMQLALRQGADGLGQTWPNPSVGCILVKDNKLIAIARTAQGGRPHAETQAIEAAGEQARGATAYLTLEPCSHTGQTPPCVEALISAGITRAVIATADPDPRVSGRGIAKLREAGIDVILGVGEAEARAQHAGFFRRVQHGLPFVAMKIATSLDGKMALADGQSQWLTGHAARQHAHRLRAGFDAIVTGIGTVLADNPRFTCRLPGLGNHSPVRVVLDPNGRLTPELALLREQTPCWVLTRQPAKPINEAEHHVLPGSGAFPPYDVLRFLAKQGITRVLVEAGPKLTHAFLADQLVDELYWYRSPLILGDTARDAIALPAPATVADAHRWQVRSSKKLGDDTLTVYNPASCLPALSPIAAPS